MSIKHTQLISKTVSIKNVFFYRWMYKVHRGDNVRKASEKDEKSVEKDEKKLNNNKNIYMISSNEDEKIIKNNLDGKSSIINSGFVKDDDECTIDKVIGIVKELPPHIEHCKL